MANFHVNARRWFDRINGNTYNTIEVVFPDGSKRIGAMAYGYGEMYRQRAYELMHGAPIPQHANGSPLKPVWQWANDAGHSVTWDCVDVQRKRDLHNEGKPLPVRETWDFEVTDTFGGEANYSWVRRETRTIEAENMRALAKKCMRELREFAGFTGMRCIVDDQGETVQVTPCSKGMNKTAFMTFRE